MQIVGCIWEQFIDINFKDIYAQKKHIVEEFQLQYINLSQKFSMIQLFESEIKLTQEHKSTQHAHRFPENGTKELQESSAPHNPAGKSQDTISTNI